MLEFPGEYAGAFATLLLSVLITDYDMAASHRCSRIYYDNLFRLRRPEPPLAPLYTALLLTTLMRLFSRLRDRCGSIASLAAYGQAVTMYRQLPSAADLLLWFSALLFDFRFHIVSILSLALRFDWAFIAFLTGYIERSRASYRRYTYFALHSIISADGAVTPLYFSII